MSAPETLQQSLARIVLSVYMDGANEGVRVALGSPRVPQAMNVARVTRARRPALATILVFEGHAIEPLAEHFIREWCPGISSLRQSVAADPRPNLDRMIGVYHDVRAVLGVPYPSRGNS